MRKDDFYTSHPHKIYDAYGCHDDIPISHDDQDDQDSDQLITALIALIAVVLVALIALVILLAI